MKLFKKKYVRGFNMEDVDPQKAGERMEELLKSIGRPLTAEDVIADAKSPTSPLHVYEFRWEDESDAAHQWRLHVARNLINSITYEIIEKDEDDETMKDVHAFTYVAVKDEQTNETSKGYVETEVVAESEELMEQVMNRFRNDIRALERKYDTYDFLRDRLKRIVATST